MRRHLIAGGALLGLVALATTADASPPLPMQSHGGSFSIHRAMTPSLLDSRHNNWKKPLDSDEGGPSDPTPKTSGKGTSGGGKTGGTYPVPRRPGYLHNPHR